MRLFLFDSICRAVALAGAALKTDILVDLVMLSTLCNSVCRTSVCAGTAAYASVSKLIHVSYLL